MMVKQPQEPTMTRPHSDEDESSTVSSQRLEEKQQELAAESAVFRRRMDAPSDELEEFWALKHATPVFEEDEAEEEFYESPTKRQCQELSWDDCSSSTSADRPFQLTVSSSGQFFL